MASLSFLLCIWLLVSQTDVSDAKSILPMNAVGSSRNAAYLDGHVVGDMLLNTEQWGRFLQRNAAGKDYLWPLNCDGIPEIHYMISDASVDVKQFELALSRWEEATCVKFKELPKGDTSVTSYLNVLTGYGCLAGVGYNPYQPTIVSLDGAACDYKGMLHELGHAFSFHHEQSRSDRDDAIVVVTENIQNGLEGQFVKEKTSNDGTPYDYMSVMHYGGRAGGKDNARVMLTKEPRFQNLIGTFKDLSFYDYKHFNIIYGCDKGWLKLCELAEEPCQNDGFTGKACSCVCPLGTEGPLCQNRIMSYNAAILDKYAPLSERIRTSGAVVQSPGYDKGRSDGVEYVQVVEAPKCERAILTFQDFQIQGRYPNTDKCWTDYLEIRTDVTVPQGEIYCGEEITKGQVFKSDNSMLILRYSLYEYQKQNYENPHRGYKAKFTTEPISGCTP